MNNTEEISLPLILKKKTTTYKIIVGISISLGLIAIIENIEKNEYASSITIIAGLFFLFSQLFLDIRSLKIKEYKIIGVISLSINEIILKMDSDNSDKKYTEVKSLKLEVSETSRDPIFRTGVVGAGIINRKRDGVENIISIELDENNSINYNFLIEDIKTIYLIDDFLKNTKLKFKLTRNGKNIKSIKEAHLKDYPKSLIKYN